MASDDCERSLHALRPRDIYQPRHNAIPPELITSYDPAFVEHYNRHYAGRLHTHEIPIAEYRKNPGAYAINCGRAKGPNIYRISQLLCPVSDGVKIPVRVFQPARKLDKSDRAIKRAAYINFHGGGWVFGDLSTDHDFCKRLVDGLDGHLVVFDVGYRLAPENKFPVPVNDCWEALNWIRYSKADELNLDIDRFIIGGMSAGGHLAAVMTHLCRDAGIALCLQVLCVPVCDVLASFTSDGQFDRERTPYKSYQSLEHSQPLPASRMAYFHRQFLGDQRSDEASQPQSWMVSPILAPEFSGLPPALIFTAEMDPLCDEGEAYALRLQDAHVPVTLIRVPGAPHTFGLLDGILESGRSYNKTVIDKLREVCIQ